MKLNLKNHKVTITEKDKEITIVIKPHVVKYSWAQPTKKELIDETHTLHEVTIDFLNRFVTCKEFGAFQGKLFPTEKDLVNYQNIDKYKIWTVVNQENEMLAIEQQVFRANSVGFLVERL